MKARKTKNFILTLSSVLLICGISFADTNQNMQQYNNSQSMDKEDPTNDLKNDLKKLVNDAKIVAKIKVLYLNDEQLKPFEINITSDNQVVKLEGEVNTDSQYEKAVMIAESIDGVKDVNADDLKVKESKQPLQDIYITAKIKGMILRHKFFGDKDVLYWPVTIETKNGIVYISGSVENEKQKDNIITIAKNIDGVKSVNSTLTVMPMKDNDTTNELMKDEEDTTNE